jgi:glycosyltransferase involved in cell wall biosynthesis
MPSETRNHPMVSVVITTYNRANLIARSIQSVLNQSYSDFEIIVVDDGSDDDTEAAVWRFTDEALRYIRLEGNKGPGAARNMGIQKCRGRFIAFQDSDDEWLPEKLEKHMRIFKEHMPGVGFVYSDMRRILKDGTTIYHKSPTLVPGDLINPASQFYQVHMLGIQSTVIKKECFEYVGYFDERFRCFEDLELFLRLSRHYDHYHIREPLVNYYETNGVSTNWRAELHARALLLKKYGKELFKKNKEFFFREYAFVYAQRLINVAKHYGPLIQRIKVEDGRTS